MSVYRKLMQARLTLQSKDLKKSGENKFAGYKYFELGDFLPAVQVIFGEIGLCGIVSYGKEMATLTIIELDGDGKIVIESPMSEAALKGCHPVQNLGAVETYIRRYLWVTAMEIVEHDALDATVGKQSGLKHKPTDGAMEGLPEETQVVLRDMAVEILAYSDAGRFDKCVQTMEEAGLESDEKVALWSLLPSGVRSAIKKLKAEK